MGEYRAGLYGLALVDGLLTAKSPDGTFVCVNLDPQDLRRLGADCIAQSGEATDLEGLWKKLDSDSGHVMGTDVDHWVDSWDPLAAKPIITQWATEHDAELMAREALDAQPSNRWLSKTRREILWSLRKARSMKREADVRCAALAAERNALQAQLSEAVAAGRVLNESASILNDMLVRGDHTAERYREARRGFIAGNDGWRAFLASYEANQGEQT